MFGLGVERIVDCQMLGSLLKACAAMSILVKISFSMLLSAEMKLPRYLKSFTSSNTFPLIVVFLVLHVFSLGLRWGYLDTKCFCCVVYFLRYFLDALFLGVGKVPIISEVYLLVMQ